MGRLFLIDLEGYFYSCKHCFTHLALVNHILSKNFTLGFGRAYLFAKVVNVMGGTRYNRRMVTGLHTVVDVHCVRCASLVGFKFLFAYDMNQKDKEGKFIFERCQLVDPRLPTIEDA